MDFIADVSQSNSFDSILVVVVDHLMKIVHFIPCNKSIIGKNTTKLFFDHFFIIMDFLKTSFMIMDPNLHLSSWSGFLNY